MARKPTVPAKGADVQKSPPDDLRELIEREIGPLVDRGQREIIIERVQQIVVSEFFAGPIAHPRHLKAYEEVEPGAANRIITMAERTQDYNIIQGTKVVDAEIADRKLGMWLGFASLIILVGLATLFGLMGKDLVAGLFLTAAALGAIGVFVNGRARKQ